MIKRPSDQRLTLEERIAVVIAFAVAVGVHLAVFLGGSGIGHIVQKEKKRERLMVIRQVRETTPAPDIAVRVPDPRRAQAPPEAAPEGKAGGASPKAEQKAEQKTPPREPRTPPPKAEVTPKMEEDLQAAIPKEGAPTEGAQKGTEIGENSVSVVTDLPGASFTISGPAEYRGTGTFWIRRGAPAGTYRIAFSAVAGFSLPPPQTKELPEKGQIVFVGKYKRSTEVVVDINQPGAQVTIYRPDGRPLDVNGAGRALIDDLPPGTYTAVFKEVPGRITPAPMSSTLSPGGKLSFSGEYRDVSAGRGAGVAGAGADAGAGANVGAGGSAGAAGSDGSTSGGQGRGSGTGRQGSGSGGGGGHGKGSGGKSAGADAATMQAAAEAGLDWRVQVIVESYPKTKIVKYHDEVQYPEEVIRKSNYQKGWHQVYFVLKVNDSGEIETAALERPPVEDRARVSALIRTAENAVRSWNYDKVEAEVHVDIRFFVE